jgi:hypothetical protein
MAEARLLAWSQCERLTRQFYRALDRNDVSAVDAIAAQDCRWVRGADTLVGPEAMRSVFLGRDPSLKTRHLVCNAVASDTGADEIEVNFDLLCLSAAEDPPRPKVLSGTDRYRQVGRDWRLAFKQATFQF